MVQNNGGNKYSPLTIVVPLTANKNKKNTFTHVTFTAHSATSGAKVNIALCEQVLTIPKDYIRDIVDRVPCEVMEKIDEKLKISLGLK